MEPLSRLKWQCRRGTKELDFLLNRYLETEYSVAEQKEKELFHELLGMEDDKLIGVLMGEWVVEGMKDLIETITGVKKQDF